MLVFDRENWPAHRPWAIVTALLAVAGFAWCLTSAWTSTDGRWPGGGSWPGLVLGTLGGAICLFEMLLWPRKLLRRMRLGRTKSWMKAHLWLGLLSLPLLLFHGGFNLDPSRSPLAVILLWSVLLLVLSGIFGGILQTYIPKRMLEELPAETIAAQIPQVLRSYASEAGLLVSRTAGAEYEPSGSDTREGSIGFVTTEVLRKVGHVQGKVVQTLPEARPIAGTDRLIHFHQSIVQPFLQASRRDASRMELASSRRAAVLFQGVKADIPPEAHSVVDRLADLCEQRRQFDRQVGMDRWLHGWLIFHFALSMAMLMMLFAHVYIALKYH